MGNCLDSVFGGYDKKDFIAKTDAYNRLIEAIDKANLSDAAINAELLKIRRMPLRKAKCLFLPCSGFSSPQTDSYIAELEEMIQKKIML